MKNIILFLFGLCSFSLLANYEIVVTNSVGESKLIKFKQIKVPEIIEIRDPVKVFRSISISNYNNDILLHKLTPRLQVTKIPEFTEITKFDLKDIVVNPVNIDYSRLFNIANNLDYIDPTINISDLLDPSIKINNLLVSNLGVNKLSINDIRLYYGDVSTYTFDISQLYNNMEVTSLDVTDTSVDEIKVSSIDVVVTKSIYEELERLRNLSKFKRSYTKYGYKSKAYLKDLDDLYDYLRNQWIEVLLSNTNCNINLVKNNNRYKITSEIQLVTNTNGLGTVNNKYDKKLLSDNLSVLKSLGYDSVLVRFDCTEDLYLLSRLVDDIRSTGFNVFITYTGLDNMNPKWNPFNVYPWTLVDFLNELAPKSTGLLLNWRCLSAHIRVMPMEFYNFICNKVREVNKDILIYGEVYYGHLGSLNERLSLFSNIPKNVTGVIINNMGYYGYNHKYAINELLFKLVPNFKNLDKIGQVIGYVPYYNSRLNLGLTIKQEYKYKSNIENSFRSLRCSTLTLLHDGVDDNYVLKGIYKTNDNILNENLIKWELK